MMSNYTFVAQLQRLHINIENLREEKDSEIASTRDELLSARDEILLLHQAAEKAASERDTDIASLQEELKKVRAELERWRKAASEYFSFGVNSARTSRGKKQPGCKVRNVLYIKLLMLDTDNFITCTESNAVRLIFSSITIDCIKAVFLY